MSSRKDEALVAEMRRDAEHYHDFQADEVLALIGVVDRMYARLNSVESILQSSYEWNDARRLWDIERLFWPPRHDNEPPSDDGVNDLRGGTEITRAAYRDQQLGGTALSALRQMHRALELAAPAS